jgi:hypothetical protein
MSVDGSLSNGLDGLNADHRYLGPERAVSRTVGLTFNGNPPSVSLRPLGLGLPAIWTLLLDGLAPMLHGCISQAPL